MKAMIDFAEYQKLWVTKGIDDTSLKVGRSLAESLLGRLKSFESHQTKLNRIKLAGSFIGVALIIFSVVQIEAMPVISYVGIALILLCNALFLVYYIKNQFNTSRLDFSSAENDFLDHALGMLHRQNAIFKIPLLSFFLSMIIGLNLFYFGLFEKSAMVDRILVHIAATILVGLASCLGYFIRVRRIKKEVTPLISELEQIKENLKSEK